MSVSLNRRIGAFTRTRRNVTNLALAMSVAFCLFILNSIMVYLPGIYGFFQQVGDTPTARMLVNGVFFWIAMLLFVAFQYWRHAEQRRDELEAVLDGINPDVLVVVDPERNIRMCNRSMERVFGYGQEEALCSKTDILYKDRRSSADLPHEVGETVRTRGFHFGTATGIRKDGGTLPLEVITAELASRAGAVMLLRDIRERVREQEATRRLEEQVHRREKMESVGVMAGGIAHDFNNLLASILGNAELVTGDMGAEHPCRGGLDEITRSAKQAATLCRDLLAYAGKGKWRVEPLNLSKVVESARHVLGISVNSRHRIEYRLAEPLPSVDGDSAQMQQVVYNLVRNASEAMGQDEGAITVATGSMKCDENYLRATYFDIQMEPGTYVYLQVSDTGCGIDASAIPKVFDPFFSTKYARPGLGLASVRGIVEGLHGTVRVDSVPGRGSTFTVLLPPSSGRAVAASAERGDAADADIAGWRGKGSVLVIEDDKPVLSFVARLLQSAGLEVLTAEDGDTGIRLLRENAARVDVALVDLGLPGLHGEAMWREIRVAAPDVRVIIISGHRPEDTPWVDQTAGFLQKPFTVARVLTAVKGALEKPR
jgi:two-component system, cell cycle sensor histidine kinase and response regulator CckA